MNPRIRSNSLFTTSGVERLVLVVNEVAARAKHANLAQQLGAQRREARAIPERSAIAVQCVVRGLEIADALEGSAHAAVVLGALGVAAGGDGEQWQQMHQPDLHRVQIDAVEGVERARGFADRDAVAAPGIDPASRRARAHDGCVQLETGETRGSE
jgi:hypothetical protein